MFLVPCKIEDLWYFQGHRPTEIPPNSNPFPSELLDEIKELYKHEFAPGCSNIFETDWYKEHGSDAMIANTDMCQAMAELIKHYKYIGTGQNFAVENKCRVFETMVVWKLLSLCRFHKSSKANGATNPTTPDFKLDELNNRLDIMEALLTNTILPSNPLADFKYPEGLPSIKLQQIDFWRNVGTFVSTQPETPDSSRQIEAALGNSRNLLAMNENRDVIYSIMICRQLGRRFQGFPDHLQSRPEGGELDNANKVVIARDFITNEANWKGTTHPIQRICDMAIRSWAVRPVETA
jgi:white-opaque regulator 2